MNDIEALVDDILERCVPGYRPPKRKLKAKPRPAVKVSDGFELDSAPPHGSNPAP